MRIVFIRSNPVSPYPRLEKTANSLKNSNHKVHILAWDRSEKYKGKNSIIRLKDNDVTITRFGIPAKFGGGFRINFIPLIKFQVSIISWLIRNRKSYDIIHAYDFDTGYTALKCARLLKKKIVYDIPDYYVDSHGLKGTKLGEYIEKKEHDIINKSDATIICTEKRKKQIYGSKPKNLTIIHNSPVDVGLNVYQNSINNKTIKVVYVGILAEGRFIKEIAETIIRRNDCELHIGGFGILEKYFEDLSEKHNNIKFYGKLQYNETLQLEQNCDIMTAIYDPSIPNHYYAAPNKFYEALMLGKPLIMAKNTGMDYIVEENKIGEVIDYSIDSFNEALDNLICNRDEWMNMSNRAKQLYQSKYSWKEMEKRLIELYEIMEEKY